MTVGAGSRLRIVFMGTPHFAVPALETLLQAGHDVVAVYTQPPRPAGRGQNLQKSAVQDCAEKHGLPVHTPNTLKTPDAQAGFAALEADVAVVAAYGLILPGPVLAAPRYGCINIHASLLPRWRGASPIQHAIWKGDAQTGITIMQMNAGLDTGDMLRKEAVEITPQTTCPALHDTLSAMGGRMIRDVLARIDDLTPEAQDDAASCYAPMLKKEDGRIDWRAPAVEIDRQIRALNPWPGTFTMGGGKRIKILAAELDEAIAGPPGRLLDRDGRIACGRGGLRLLKIQPEGARAMDVPAAVNGGALTPGMDLE